MMQNGKTVSAGVGCGAALLRSVARVEKCPDDR